MRSSVLYHIDTNAQQQHIDGFFPKTLDERIDQGSGWIFCRADSVYVAFFPLKPYQWIEEKADWRWRSSALKNGVVVEVGSAEEDGSFVNFQYRITKSKPVAENFDETLTIEYRTRHGDVMKFTYNGERSLNGKKVDFLSYKLFNGPFIQSDRGSGIVTMKYNGHARQLDFNKAAIKEWQ